jgi:hypothetical protein
LVEIGYEGEVGSGDRCVYEEYVEVHVWEMGDVPVKPLFIVGLVFGVFVGVMLVWFALVRWRMRVARKQLYYLNEQAVNANATNANKSNDQRH